MVMLLSVWPATAAPIKPDSFDPLLDRAPGEGPAPRYAAPRGAGSGFTVSGHAGIYAGSVKSYLTEELSTLLEGARPSFGFGLGVRLDSPIELGLDLDLGLGSTFAPETGVNIASLDILIEPRVLAHWYESWPAGAYAGIGALAVLFDIGEAGISQAGVGPSILLGILRRAGPHSLFFLEVGATYFYDAFAYEVTTQPVQRPDGSIEQVTGKDDGAWFTIFRITLGYRLTSF